MSSPVSKVFVLSAGRKNTNFLTLKCLFPSAGRYRTTFHCQVWARPTNYCSTHATCGAPFTSTPPRSATTQCSSCTPTTPCECHKYYIYMAQLHPVSAIHIIYTAQLQPVSAINITYTSHVSQKKILCVSGTLCDLKYTL